MKPWEVFAAGAVLGIAAAVAGETAWSGLRSSGAAADSIGGTAADMQGDPGLVTTLEAVRQGHGLPALGGAIVDSSGMRSVAVVGVRKRGESAGATVDDAWHLGSDAKAMTATMIAALVERGTLAWDATVDGVFPELNLPEPAGRITLLQLLSHRSGLPANADWGEISKSGSLVEQRRTAVARLASAALLSEPGAKFAYSNWGYVVAAAMAERAAGKSYEGLMQETVFGPLRMGSVGYGAAAGPGKLVEPWGHSADGTPRQGDNPLVMAPAGCVHCTLADWGRFVSDQLRGAAGRGALLRPESYTFLHTAPFGGTYALGWRVVSRPWGGGQVFTHAGSNTMNMAVVWMAPARDFAVLVVCNQGGSEKACDEVAAGLIARHGAAGGVP